MKIHNSGDTIGSRYKVIDFFNEGGMQEVYRAKDLSFGRTVALKVPKNPSASKRFRRSAIVSAQVNHPSVAKTLDFLDYGGNEYLVEEFVSGENLRERLDKLGILDPFIAAHIFVHICRGLSASHHVGIVHRDLKPGNILLSSETWPEVIKISDFGIARMAEEELVAAIGLGIEKSITTSNTIVGALPYMSPEAISDPKNAELSADVWSVGAMLYEMLAGKKPFGQGLAAAAAITKGTLPVKPKLLGDNVQFGLQFEGLWSIVERTLVVDTSKRATADELVEACGKLCFPIERRSFGKIIAFNKKNAMIAYIESPGMKDVMFHRSSYYGPGSPKIGDLVAFAKYPGTPNERAFPVVSIKSV